MRHLIKPATAKTGERPELTWESKGKWMAGLKHKFYRQGDCDRPECVSIRDNRRGMYHKNTSGAELIL